MSIDLTGTPNNRENARNWANILACVTMPVEGIFFFGAAAGYPVLAEIYKSHGVFESLCDSNETFNFTMNSTINCHKRDVMFTYVYRDRLYGIIPL